MALGGKREGSGRKPKADEEKANNLFVSALKEIYRKDTDDEAKKAFIKDTLMESQRGQLFLAEHIFGKAPQEVKNTNFNVDASEFTAEQIKKINDALEDAY